jgi:uncharacterized protein
MAKVEGSETLSLPRTEVWRRLNDPDILAESIPGCSGFELIGRDEFQTSITVVVGPVRGAYAGTVRYLDVEAPERCTIAVQGRGDKGTIQGEGKIALGESGTNTEVSYTGTFKLTGPVAGVGQRLAPGISRRMIIDTLRNLESALGDAALEAGHSAQPSSAQPSAAGAAEPRGAPGAATKQVSPVIDGRRSTEFRPFALPGWALFALGVAIGVVITIILEAVL